MNVHNADKGIWLDQSALVRTGCILGVHKLLASPTTPFKIPSAYQVLSPVLILLANSWKLAEEGSVGCRVGVPRRR